jgi:hypothetical protein
VPNYHIIRLPALFGKGIKKNFIYDITHPFPSKLDTGKFETFATKESIISDCYRPDGNGFFSLNVSLGNESALHEAFLRLDFSSARFTDSRSILQFYNLAHLWDHINIAILNNVKLLHLAVEKLSAADVYSELIGHKFNNITASEPIHHDFRTRHDSLFGGCRGYIFDRNKVISDLKTFTGMMK